MTLRLFKRELIRSQSLHLLMREREGEIKRVRGGERWKGGGEREMDGNRDTERWRGRMERDLERESGTEMGMGGWRLRQITRERGERDGWSERDI